MFYTNAEPKIMFKLNTSNEVYKQGKKYIITYADNADSLMLKLCKSLDASKIEYAVLRENESGQIIIVSY